MQTVADQATEDLRRLVRAGEHGPDGRLPSEASLAARLGVSRVTLRQAIATLEQEGLVFRRQGLGTFVIRRALELENILNTNFGITDFIRSAGRRPGTADLAVRQSAADARVSGALAVSPGDPVVVIERTRTADDERVARTVDVMSLALLEAHGLNPARLEESLRREESLYRLLRTSGIHVRNGLAEVRPIEADADLARHFAVVPGCLLVHLIQVDYSPHGEAVLLSDEYLVPDSLSIRVYRKGPD